MIPAESKLAGINDHKVTDPCKNMTMAWLLAATTQLAAVLPGEAASKEVRLPQPNTSGTISVEQALQERRSVRDYGKGGLTLSEIGQLLWAAQGITSRKGLRTAPSAGALYPLEIYLVARKVSDLEIGVHHYDPSAHVLNKKVSGDRHAQLAKAAVRQTWIKESAAVLVITAVYERTTRKYGQRGIRYVHMEVGHAAQNVFLQATALGLEAVVVGAFDDTAVSALIQGEPDERPLYLIPVGTRR